MQNVCCSQLLVLAGLIPLSGIAQEIHHPLSVDPFLGARLGSGYDTVGQIPSGSARHCIEFDLSKIFDDSAQAGDEKKVIKVTSHSEMVDLMDLSIDAAFKAVTGAGTLRTGTALNVIDSTKITRNSETSLLYAYVRKPTKILDPNFINLTDDWKQRLARPEGGSVDAVQIAEFRKSCGDSFVWGLQSGARYVGSHSKEEVREERINSNDFKFNVEYDGAKRDVSANLKRVAKRLENLYTVREEISVNSSETGLSQPRTLADLEQQYDTFNPANPNKPILLLVAPYSYANGYPSDSPLSQPPEEAQLRVLIEALWDLRTLDRESEEVLERPSDYALGLSEATRRQYRNFVSQLRSRWLREFSDLQAATKNCITNFTKSCEARAFWYGVNPRITEREYLPKKKSNFCEAPFLVTLTDRNQTMSYPDGKWARMAGDNEMGGGPVRVRAYLSIEPIGTDLIARLHTVKQEWKTDNNGRRHTSGDRSTTFDDEQVWTIFSMAPDYPSANTGEDPFSECFYWEDGVAQPAQCAAGDGRRYHGFVDWTSGRNPRGSKTIRTNCGASLLRSIDCSLDKGGDDHSLPCKAPVIRSVQVELKNRLDKSVEDNWSPTLLARIPNFDRPNISAKSVLTVPQIRAMERRLESRNLGALADRLPVSVNRTLQERASITDTR